MLNLIFETSAEKGIILLASENIPLRWTFLEGGPELSKNLALETQKLLDSSIPDRIFIGEGPGSYTGARVGAALAKGLAYGFKVPLISFCSLKIYGALPILLDARKEGFYALFEGIEHPLLINLEDPRLFQQKFFSPHPDLIQKRLSIQIFRVDLDPHVILDSLNKTVEFI